MTTSLFLSLSQVKDDGTMSSENAATFKDHVMTFQEKSKIELQRTSSVGGGFDGKTRLVVTVRETTLCVCVCEREREIC
jgi:hypothetical protein